MVFAGANLRHYALALWGLRLRLDPDYPLVRHFFPSVIHDSVFEYRTYALMVPWSVFLAWALPDAGLSVLIVLWAMVSTRRALCYRSALAFWGQAYKESPHKTRVRTAYTEALIFRMHELQTSNDPQEDWRPLADKAEALINTICEVPK